MSKTTRRVGVIASLALLPALLFGGAASAAAIEAPAENTRPSHSETKPLDPDKPARIQVRGEILKIVNIPEEDLLLLTAGVPENADRAPTFAVTPETVIEAEESGRIEVGDKVTVTGKYVPGADAFFAEHVKVH